MLTSVIEAFVQKFAGRYLKNFSSENISIGISSVKFTNVEVDTDKLAKLHLPYKPIRLFFGELTADLSFIFGGNFDVQISDALFVIQRDNREQSADFSTFQSIVQSVIAAFYFSYDLAQESKKTKRNLSAADLEKMQKMFDKFIVKIEKFHIRIEETFQSYLRLPEGNTHMCTGVVMDCLEVRPVTSAEVSTNTSAFVTLSSKVSLVVNKILKCTNMSVYCRREPSINSSISGLGGGGGGSNGVVAEALLTLQFVKSLFYHRSSGNILSPLSFTINFSGGFQKLTQVFGPVLADVKFSELNANCTDEQAAYIVSVVHVIMEWVYRLQLRSRLALIRAPADETVQKGRGISSTANAVIRNTRSTLRWALIRQSIQVDWKRYCDKLKDGKLRWRSWFQTWRQAAKYVALRQILMYHVGYETHTDSVSKISKYSLAENLIVDFDQNRHRSSTGDEEDMSTTKDAAVANTNDRGDDKDSDDLNIQQYTRMDNFMREKYVGRGYFTENIMVAAEMVLRRQMFSGRCFKSGGRGGGVLGGSGRKVDKDKKDKTKALRVGVSADKGEIENENNDDEYGDDEEANITSMQINPFELSATIIKALYALQLELDATLPFKMCAYCRLYAESIYRMKKEAYEAERKALARSNSSTVASSTSAGESPVPKKTIFLAVIDGDNLTPGFGSSSIRTDVLLQSCNNTDMWALIGDDDSSNAATHDGDGARQGEYMNGVAKQIRTSTVDARMNPAGKSGFAVWGEAYSLILDEATFARGIGDAIDKVGSTLNNNNNNNTHNHNHIAIECFNKALFTVSYGGGTLPLSTLISGDNTPAAYASAALFGEEEYSGEICTHNLILNEVKQQSSGEGRASSATGTSTTADSVALRIMSMFVVSKSSQSHLDASKKFLEAVRDSAAQRSTYLERREQLEAHAKISEQEKEEDEVFVLDPTMLTLQGLSLKVSLPSVCVTGYFVYSLPEKLRADALFACAGKSAVAHLAHVPLARVSIKNIEASAGASNNPWIIQGSGSVKSIQLDMLHEVTRPVTTNAATDVQTDTAATSTDTCAASPAAASDIMPHTAPLLSLPTISATFSVTQISTMGRFISGALDSSCFDFKTSWSMLPFGVTINPLSLAAVNDNDNCSSSNREHTTDKPSRIWKSFTTLPHLFLRPIKWAKGVGQGHMSGAGGGGGGGGGGGEAEGNSVSRVVSEEASLRLGDQYVQHPRHLNIVTDVKASSKMLPVPFSVAAADYKYDAKKKLTPADLKIPKQQTSIRCSTAVRSLDIDVTFKPQTDDMFVQQQQQQQQQVYSTTTASTTRGLLLEDEYEEVVVGIGKGVSYSSSTIGTTNSGHVLESFSAAPTTAVAGQQALVSNNSSGSRGGGGGVKEEQSAPKKSFLGGWFSGSSSAAAEAVTAAASAGSGGGGGRDVELDDIPTAQVLSKLSLGNNSLGDGDAIGGDVGGGNDYDFNSEDDDESMDSIDWRTERLVLQQKILELEAEVQLLQKQAILARKAGGAAK